MKAHSSEMQCAGRPSSRRAILKAGTSALVGSCLAQADPIGPVASSAKLKVAIFSKHLLFLQGSSLAQAAADMGFDGIDLAVRKGGHVQPDRVKQDLPALVAIIRQHGLEVPMITTDISDTKTPFAEDILRCMSELGIRYYRWGGFKYMDDKSIPAQLDSLKPRVAQLASLNSRYHATAMYHTHSGIDLVGAPIWDLHELLTGMDPTAVGVNYDIGHATVEGGFGGWIDSFRVTGAYVQGIAVKDFLWEKNSYDQWRPAWRPLGQGMVNFPKFFQMVAVSHFSGPLQLHFEYPLHGADEGLKSVSNPNEVFSAMKRDLTTLRSYLSQAGLG